MRKVLFVLFLVALFFTQGAAQDRFLIKVSPVTPEETKLLSVSGIKALTRTADFYLAEATSENLENLRNSGISYQVLDDEPEFSLYFFVWCRPDENISDYLDRIKEKAKVLEAEGSRAIVKGHPRRIEELTSYGLSLRLIKKRAMPIKTEEELPFILKKTPAYDPQINEIMQKVTTSKLTGYVADLSGENPVEIGGSPETLFTRYTYTDGCDKAGQYLKEKFEGFGLTAWYDTFYIGPSIYYVMDIVSTPTGDTAWLGCYYSGIWKTTDAGNSWNNISGTDYYDLWALSAPTPDTLYGAGNYGVIIESTDGGESWFELSTPTTQNLRGAYFDGSQTGWVAGYGGLIYYTSNGGQSWTSQSSGTTSNLYEITFVDDTTGWITGSGGKIIHTVDRGTNWSSQTSGTTGIIFGIDFATPEKGWVCGQSGYIRYTSNAGTNWNSQTSGSTDDLYMVSAPDSFQVWVGGLYTILHTTNAGTNWSFQSASYNYGYFYEIYFLDTLKGWTTGYDDILYTTDGGQNWVQQADNLYPRYERYNVVAVLPGQTEPGKECLITGHYDDTSEDPYNVAPGADDNASGTAAVLVAAEILKDYDFDYTIKFIGFPGEEQGLLGSDAYAYKAQQRGDTIIGVYNFDMIAWEGDDNNIIELHAGTGASSQALADVTIGVINDYSLSLIPQKITSGATDRSDHASFWTYGYPAILGIEDFDDFHPNYHTTGDLLSVFDLPYFTDFGKAGIASVAILAQPIQTFIYGDANGDGDISVSDVVYIINYLFKGGPAPDPLLSADVDCNGDVNVSDVVYLINYLFKGGPPPGC